MKVQEVSEFDTHSHDRWGSFKILSGYEGKGCFWCGSETKFRYCSDDCRFHYWASYNWQAANEHCRNSHRIEPYLDRLYSCDRCDFVGGYSDFQVHHIVPVGSDRSWSILNRPENLIHLCKHCHMWRHREMGRAAVISQMGIRGLPLFRRT